MTYYKSIKKKQICIIKFQYELDVSVLETTGNQKKKKKLLAISELM